MGSDVEQGFFLCWVDEPEVDSFGLEPVVDPTQLGSVAIGDGAFVAKEHEHEDGTFGHFERIDCFTVKLEHLNRGGVGGRCLFGLREQRRRPFGQHEQRE